MGLTTADFKDKWFGISERLLVSESSGCFGFCLLSGFSWVSPGQQQDDSVPYAVCFTAP